MDATPKPNSGSSSPVTLQDCACSAMTLKSIEPVEDDAMPRSLRKHRADLKNRARQHAGRGAALCMMLLSTVLLTMSSLGMGTPPIARRRMQAAPPRPEVSPVRLAFFLQISENTMDHLPRLLRRIWEPCNVYAIHLDAKAAGGIGGLRERLFNENSAYAENVHFMEPELITYRGVSMLLNTINAIQLLLEKDQSWTAFINLSGSDYPMVTPARQREFLSTASRSLNYIAFAPRHKWERNNQYRYAHFYIDEALAFPHRTGRTSVVEVFHKNPISDRSRFTYTNAEAWMIASRQFCEYVTTSAAARKLLVTFAFSVESSEHYFSTLAYNSRFNATVVHSSLRTVIWEHAGKQAGQHPFYVDERASDGSYPLQARLLASPKFYSRKFKHADSPLMDLVDRQAEDPAHLREVGKHFNWLLETARQRAAEQPDRMPFD